MGSWLQPQPVCCCPISPNAVCILLWKFWSASQIISFPVPCGFILFLEIFLWITSEVYMLPPLKVSTISPQKTPNRSHTLLPTQCLSSSVSLLVLVLFYYSSCLSFCQRLFALFSQLLQSHNCLGLALQLLVQLPCTPFTFWWCNAEWWLGFLSAPASPRSPISFPPVAFINTRLLIQIEKFQLAGYWWTALMLRVEN